MMSDKEFTELELRAAICPRQCSWPKSEYVLHEAANEARARVSQAYMLMDEIDRNADLSPDAKYLQRLQIASQAIADFEASKTLARAREAVAKHNSDDVAEGRDAALKAMKETDAGWQKAIDKISERVGLTKGVGVQRR